MIGILKFLIILGFGGMLSTTIISALKCKTLTSLNKFNILFYAFCLITSVAVMLWAIINHYTI